MTRLKMIVVAGIIVAFIVPGVGSADEGGEALPARTLIQQAVGLLRAQPDMRELIEDRIVDALKAEDTEGVDLALVSEAKAAWESGDAHRAQDLLEESIGAAPHRVVTSPNPKPGQPAPTEPRPSLLPVVHERELAAGFRAPSGTAGPLLLGFAVLLVIAGGFVVRRVH